LSDEFSLSDFLQNLGGQDPSSSHEKLVWELASILFDATSVPSGVENIPNVINRLRKDKLSNFWQKLVEQASAQHAAMARSNEEKAIASLSGHRIPDACSHLINGKDFHLATLVSLIGGKDSLRKDIREQLGEWQKSRVLSEFSQPIRTIYELLAGNVCVVDGSKGSLEDRIESFTISKRFGLDWRQAFGLRLWYATLSTENIEAAVKRFDEDIRQDKEASRPRAWYVEQKIATLWDDRDLEYREDLLWGLLKLYTYQDADLEAVLRPENSRLSPVDIRLSWQLSRALISFGGIDYRENADEKRDQITLSFALQLTNEHSWLDAVYVLLHLSSAAARAKSIQDHLAHHADHISSEDSQEFLTLTQAFQIPPSWVWEAKALYMRSVKKNPLGEVECLVRAGMFEEAHRTFSNEVGPKTIIECDYTTLRTLLGGFHGKENAIPEWHLGGGIYQDFLELLASQKKSQALNRAVVNRLLVALPAVVEESRHPSFLETVAIETISEVVAKTVVEMEKKGEVRNLGNGFNIITLTNSQKPDLPKILKLPLTEDKYLKHTCDLSLGYYKSVMSSGR